MAEKTINTRIKLKYDSYANWTTNNPTLLAGEVAIAYIETPAGTQEVGSIDNSASRQVLMKVGPGAYNSLQFISAKAADVHAWAKKSEADFTTWVKGLVTVDDIDLSAYYNKTEIDGKTSDLQTQITTVKTTADNAATATALANEQKSRQEAEKAINDAISAIKDGVAIDSFKDVEDQLAEKVDKVEGKGLSTNDLTDALKGQYDAAYAHSQVAHAPADAQKNVIESVKVNGTALSITDKSVDITVPTGALADKDKVAKDDLADALKKELDAKVASVTADDASVTIGGTATAPTVAAKLSGDADNALTLAADGLKVVIPTAAEYSIVKAADSGDYAAVYNLTKDGEIVGASINIPKDIVVKSGSVVGDEIVLVLNDKAATEIRIPVASLIEYVTSGSAAGDMVVITVSDDHKVTASITDGTITLAKLATDVQTAIGKAHSHDNADVLAGISAAKVADWDDAVTKEHEHDNKALLDTYDQTNADIKSAVEQKHSHTFADSDVVDAINKKHAHSFQDSAVETAIAQTHTHTNAGVLDGISAEKVSAWDGAVKNVTAAADSGLKATRSGNDVAIAIDDSITFIFDCGNSVI